MPAWRMYPVFISAASTDEYHSILVSLAVRSLSVRCDMLELNSLLGLRNDSA